MNHASLRILLLILRAADLLIDRAALQQLVMRAGPGQTAVVEHEDLIRVADGGHALRDQHDRGLPRQMRQRLAKRGVGGKVQRGGAVVEDEDGGPPHQRAGDRQPLALAAGEIAPAGLDFRVQPALLAAPNGTLLLKMVLYVALIPALTYFPKS